MTKTLNKYQLDGLLTDNELQEKLKGRPAPCVKRQDIIDRIELIKFDIIEETTTLCTIVLDNGYSVRGESACVNKENFDEDIGARYAFDDAFKKFWPLFGFLLAETQYQSKKGE